MNITSLKHWIKNSYVLISPSSVPATPLKFM